jgi:short-subunit dehydrogenase
VLEYSPGPRNAKVVPVRDLDVDDLEPMFDLRLRTPIALTRAVLPGMLERGGGGLLFAFGTQPRRPDPMLDNVGIAQAALLHHVQNLNASLAADGVYAGALLIGALIDGSEIQELLRTGGADHLPDGLAEIEYPVVSPDRLADLYWDMYVKRDRVEEVAD